MSAARRRAVWLLARCALTAAVAGALVCADGGLAPDRATAAFGDGFGIADRAGIALPGGPGGESHSFWAGTCHVATAPPIGAPIPGGAGARQDPITVHSPLATAYINPGGVNPNGSSALSPLSVPAPAQPGQCIDIGTPAQGLPAWVDLPAGGPVDQAPGWRLAPVTEAGTRPDGTTTFTFAREAGELGIDGAPDNIVVDLPPGFVGDPNAVPKCSAVEFAQVPVQCPPRTQVGLVNIFLRNPITTGQTGLLYPVYNLEPRVGKTAEFGIPDVAGAVSARIVATARTNGDFGVSALVPQIPGALDLYTQTVTLWGVPWARSHDIWRVRQGVFAGRVDPPVLPPSGLAPAERVSYDPSWGPIKPFLANPTECSGQQLLTRLATDSYLHPGPRNGDGDPDLPPFPSLIPLTSNWKTYASAADPVQGCDKPPFSPDIDLSATSTAADSATGLDVELSVPQNDDPPAAVATDPDDATGAPAHWRSDTGRATAQLDKAVVTLPEGVSVNPSGATGLAGCSDGLIGVTRPGNPAAGVPYLFDNVDPTDGVGRECPDGSKLGTVSVNTPLLDEPLSGEVVLGVPESTNPESGRMLRLFIVVRSRDRGLVAKIFGSAVANRHTGQLTATFDDNPRVPFEHMSLRFKGGPRAQLAQPQACGTPAWSAAFTPWTAAHGTGVGSAPDGGAFTVVGNCSLGFSPRLAAGMSTRQGRGQGRFSFSFSREDGEQWFDGVTAELPTGLLASVRHVPLCTSAQAGTGVCPAGSRIGAVDASAGSGDPFVLERKGDVYLTEGYKGAPYGLMVRVPVEAGPFRGQFALDPIVVRQAVHVDPVDASVTAVSDPLPRIWHGVPIRARRVTVNVDRPAFMVNPSDCSPKQVRAALRSTHGTDAGVSEPFQATGCARLPFRPKVRMRLTGRRQRTTGKHPGVRVQVTQSPGQAGIRKAVARLPKSLALDPGNAQALCEFEAGTKADLENHCPKGSIVGRARATSPLLKRPLAGNVYFVKNVRIDKKTGNEIRTLPMIIVALRGEIAVNLKGESNTTKAGKLVNTFAAVPDAPVSRFNMNINGGRTGILTVTRTRRGNIDICSGRHVTGLDLDAHNGRRADRQVRMATPCAKKGKRKATAKRRAGKPPAPGAGRPNAADARPGGRSTKRT